MQNPTIVSMLQIRSLNATSVTLSLFPSSFQDWINSNTRIHSNRCIPWEVEIGRHIFYMQSILSWTCTHDNDNDGHSIAKRWVNNIVIDIDITIIDCVITQKEFLDDFSHFQIRQNQSIPENWQNDHSSPCEREMYDISTKTRRWRIRIAGAKLFIGQIPRHMDEANLLPMFQCFGDIYGFPFR